VDRRRRSFVPPEGWIARFQAQGTVIASECRYYLKKIWLFLYILLYYNAFVLYFVGRVCCGPGIIRSCKWLASS